METNIVVVSFYLPYHHLHTIYQKKNEHKTHDERLILLIITGVKKSLDKIKLK